MVTMIHLFIRPMIHLFIRPIQLPIPKTDPNRSDSVRSEPIRSDSEPIRTDSEPNRFRTDPSDPNRSDPIPNRSEPIRTDPSDQLTNRPTNFQSVRSSFIRPSLVRSSPAPVGRYSCCTDPVDRSRPTDRSSDAVVSCPSGPSPVVVHRHQSLRPVACPMSRSVIQSGEPVSDWSSPS